MALKAEAEKMAAKKKLLEVQRGALHVQMQERENLKREVRGGYNVEICQDPRTRNQATYHTTVWSFYRR